MTSLVELNTSKQTLELGCGTGEYTLRLAKTGAKIIALDISLTLIR